MRSGLFGFILNIKSVKKESSRLSVMTLFILCSAQTEQYSLEMVLEIAACCAKADSRSR